MIRLVLSPSSAVMRKLSTLLPADGFAIGVPVRIAPPGAVNGVVIPSGVPAVDAGLKYGELSAFSISTRNSADQLPPTFTRLAATRSKRTSCGPLTTRLRTPQSPKPGDVSMQSGPLAGAR